MQSMTEIVADKESIATSPPSSSFTLKDGFPPFSTVSTSPIKTAGITILF